MTSTASIGEVEDAMHTLTPMHTLTDAPDARPLTGPSDIAFRHVSFGYGREDGGRDGHGVQDIDLISARARSWASSAPRGRASPRWWRCSCGFTMSRTGTSRSAGRTSARVTQESLRRRIGMVTQETAMFNRSARDNIAYGRPDASAGPDRGRGSGGRGA